VQDIFLKIQEIQKFVQKSRNQNYPNSYLNSEKIDIENVKSILPEFKDSFRRQSAFLKVLRTVADCDFSEKIKPSHVEKAYKVTHSNFMRLKNLG
jgi:predicted ATPase with chaperone activity